MGKRFHSYKRNKLVRSKVKTHKQRMQYEAIIQVAQIQDGDLLYLNFNNAAIGPPYSTCFSGLLIVLLHISLGSKHEELKSSSARGWGHDWSS